MRAKFGRDPMAGSKKVTLKFIIGYNAIELMYHHFTQLFILTSVIYTAV